MRSKLHLAQHLRRLALLSLCLGGMTGCQSFSIPSVSSSAVRLRVVDLSPDAGTLDIYQGSQALAYNLAYGTVTSYAALTPGTYTTTVAPAGSKQVLSSSKNTLLPGAQYTLLLHSPLASLHQTLLSDQPPASAPSVRLIHQADRTGPVDVYLVPAGHHLASLSALASNLAPGTATGYLVVPEGVSTAMVLPAGTRPSAAALALHTGRQIAYVHGSARTLILLDASPTLARPLDVIETIDTESPN